MPDERRSNRKKMEILTLLTLDTKGVAVTEDISATGIKIKVRKEALIHSYVNAKLIVDKDNIIEIQGHICCSPPNKDGYDFDSKNNNLSINRAKAVYEHLIENNINSTRMSYVGMKARFPLVLPERTEADKNKNRRVEIKILKY